MRWASVPPWEESSADHGLDAVEDAACAASPSPLSFALLSACVPPSEVPPEGRETVVRSLARQPRYLRVAVYVGPFFGDG